MPSTLVRRAGLGTQLAIDPTGASTFTVLGSITAAGISGPSAKVDAIETSLLADAVETFMPGEMDPGEVTFTIVYSPEDSTTQTLGQQLRIGPGGVVPNWQITFPAVGTNPAVSETFHGFVSALGRETKKNEMVSCSVTIRLTGDPGFAHS